MTNYFVIDTDTYAGNFEREITTYITGIVGDCGRDQLIQAHVRPLIPQDKHDAFDRIIGSESDEHGCYRPCKIYPTPDWYNNGLGFNYQDGQEDEALEEYIKCVNEDNMFEEDERDSEIEEIKKNGIGKYNAYNSVAICLYEVPDANMISFMKERAEEYAKICREKRAPEIGGSERSHGFNITGYRLVTERIATKEVKL